MHLPQYPTFLRQFYGPRNLRLSHRVSWIPYPFHPLVLEEHRGVQYGGISRSKRHSKSHSRLSGTVAEDRTGNRRREDSSSAGRVHIGFQGVQPADFRRREAGSHVGRKKEDRSMEDSFVVGALGGKSAGRAGVSMSYNIRRDIS